MSYQKPKNFNNENKPVLSYTVILLFSSMHEMFVHG